MSSDPWSGGTAVITGAASGIGAGLARAAAARGMKLVLADIAEAPLNAITAELFGKGTEVLPVVTDVTDQGAIERLELATLAKFGTPRLLINNAGIEVLGNCWELTAAQWERVVRINILAMVHGVRVFAPSMIKAGERAYISNLSSLGGLMTGVEQTPYIMSKHAVLAYSECLQLEMSLAAPFISVSTVLPGPVNTRIFKDAEVSGNAAGHRASMDKMMESFGMTGDEAGEVILPQIAENKFWITTHPQMLTETAKARAAHIAALATPVLSPEALAILGRK